MLGELEPKMLSVIGTAAQWLFGQPNTWTAAQTFSLDIYTPIVYGGFGSAGNLTLYSTSHATKGTLYLNSALTSVAANGIITANGLTVSNNFQASGSSSLIGGTSTNTITPYSGGTNLTLRTIGVNNSIAIQGLPSQVAPLLVQQGISSTSTDRDLAYFDSGFTTKTDASYTGYMSLRVQDFGNNSGGNPTGREFLRGSSNGSAAMLGAFGATPVVQPVLSYSRVAAGETAAVAAIRVALAALGLVLDSTTI
jgi:hypothetical protein